MKMRKLNASDIEEILEIEQMSFPHPWTRAMFLEELDNPFFHCLGSFEDGRLTGFLCFWTVVDEFHIGNVAVRPEYRRQGAAKALLNSVIETAKANGITGITLEVRPSNFAAISLYTAAGFSVEGARRHYYENGEDALIMWRRMTPAAD